MFKNVLVGRGHELHEEGNVLLLVAVDGAGELGKVQFDLAAQLRGSTVQLHSSVQSVL